MRRTLVGAVLCASLLAGSLCTPSVTMAVGPSWWVYWPTQVGEADWDGGGIAVLTLTPECVVWVPASFRFDSMRVCWQPECTVPRGLDQPAKCNDQLCEEVQRRQGAPSPHGRLAYFFALPADAGCFYQVRITLRRGGRLWAYQMRVFLLNPQIADP